MRHPPSHIFEFTPTTLGAWCEQRGMAPFRAKQILEWVYERGITDPAAMTNLSTRDRETLDREMTFVSCDVVAHKRATDGVQKLLVQWRDYGTDAPAPAGSNVALNVLGSGDRVSSAGLVLDSSRQTECVMIPAKTPTGVRRTACISSQVGCPVGCRFCASGLGGLEGNLSAGRIVEQVWLLRWRLDADADASLPEADDAESAEIGADEPRGAAAAKGGAKSTRGLAKETPRITNVVFMGMGEPLSNFGPVTGAIRTIASLWAMGISARKITISTVGLPAAIEKLAAEFELPVTLALSLHAPTDEIRRSLIPWANYTTIDDLLAACQKWFDKTGREITLEYTLLRGVNDQPEHARRLSDLARSLRANINLIRYNEVAGMPFERPRTDDVLRFQKLLRDRGLNTHIRASRGRDIAAACGQLRHEKAATGA